MCAWKIKVYIYIINKFIGKNYRTYLFLKCEQQFYDDVPMLVKKLDSNKYFL
jgi:hypothetical protein